LPDCIRNGALYAGGSFYSQAARVTKDLPENQADHALYLNNLAQLYRELGHFEEAEPLMKQAIENCR